MGRKTKTIETLSCDACGKEDLEVYIEMSVDDECLGIHLDYRTGIKLSVSLGNPIIVCNLICLSSYIQKRIDEERLREDKERKRPKTIKELTTSLG